VPLAKVKMSAKQEYEYVNNYKVLQQTFKAHKIDKVRSPRCPVPLPREGEYGWLKVERGAGSIGGLVKHTSRFR
jgi:hypothetical protein